MPDDEGSIFSRFFGRGQKDTNKKPDQVNQLRNLPAYQNLKDKFGEKAQELQNGLPKDGLTIGDLVDIIHLYRVSVDYTLAAAFLPVAEIVKSIDIPEGQDIKRIETEFTKINTAGDPDPSTFDRSNPLYALRPDLSKVVANHDNDLSHYPGGIMIMKTGSSNREDPRFELLLTDRDTGDRGKPVKQILRETGLPVRA